MERKETTDGAEGEKNQILTLFCKSWWGSLFLFTQTITIVA
jgi:hypothetical protein